MTMDPPAEDRDLAEITHCTMRPLLIKTDDRTISGRLGFDVPHGTDPSDTRLPLWFFLVLTSLPPIAWAVARVRRRSRLKAGLCPTCGYDLRATPNKCPECGNQVAGNTATPAAD